MMSDQGRGDSLSAISHLGQLLRSHRGLGALVAEAEHGSIGPGRIQIFSECGVVLDQTYDPSAVRRVAEILAKLEVVRVAARHSFPVGDVTQMLAEIERGYLGEPHA